VSFLLHRRRLARRCIEPVRLRSAELRRDRLWVRASRSGRSMPTGSRRSF